MKNMFTKYCKSIMVFFLYLNLSTCHRHMALQYSELALVFLLKMSLSHTVDGRNPANQLRLVVYSIIYKVLAPSQVVFSPDF